MLNLKVPYLDKRGFSLMELILGICLLSILISTIYSLMYFTGNIFKKGEEMDTALFNGRYAIEFIKDEIISADKVICSSKFENLDTVIPNNIGFVSMEEQIRYSGEGIIRDVNYNFRTYYQKEDELIRIAYNSPNNSRWDGNLFSGHNQICKGLSNFGTSKLDMENNVIHLFIDMALEQGSLILETTINLQCPTE